MAGYVSPARKALQTRASIFCGAGLLLQVVTNVVLRSARSAGSPGTGIIAVSGIVGIIALVCWFIGLSAYAESKGYSKWLSLLGLLSCCGLVIMVLLPNKWVDGASDGYGPGDYPRPNG